MLAERESILTRHFIMSKAENIKIGIELPKFCSYFSEEGKVVVVDISISINILSEHDESDTFVEVNSRAK